MGGFKISEAVGNSHGAIPDRIYTDALHAYREGVEFGFHGKVQHIANAGVAKRHKNNNRIERLNGTLRERVKVQRGWKSYNTRIAEGQRIHYNFVKPHAALEGQTPASAAGVGVEGRNKWLELLKASQRAKVARTDS